MDIRRMCMTQRALEGPYFCKDHSWDALINAYIKSGRSRDALMLCQQYQGDSLPLNRHTFVALLKACVELHEIEIGSKLHKQVSTGLLKIDPFVGSTLIDMYGKCGLPSKAQDVFDTLQAQDVVTWTALISAYAQQKLGDKALDCFQKMELAGVLPNAFTYTCILKACGSIGALERGLELHAEVARRDFVKASPFVGGALVDMYAKCCVLAKAQEVFDILPVRGVITWTSLIVGYAQLELGEEALECFDRMESEGVKPNAVTWASTLKACGSIGAADKGSDIHAEISKNWSLKGDLVLGNALIDMYGKCGMLEEAQDVFDELPVHNDVVSWNALIAGCVQHDYGEVAINFLKKMLTEGVCPNAFTFSSSLKACGSIGAAETGIELHVEIARKDLANGDLVLGNALVDMYAKCGLLPKAEDVFDELLVHDNCSWNSLVTGHAQLGDIDSVFLSLYLMREEGSQLDHVTLVNVLYTCGHAGMVDKALTYFKFIIEDYGLTPTLQHLTCMVDLLGRAGQTETAIAMINKMPYHPNKVLWHSLLSAYRKWGDVKLGWKAFEQMWELDEEDAATLVSMCNMYGSCWSM